MAWKYTRNVKIAEESGGWQQCLGCDGVGTVPTTPGKSRSCDNCKGSGLTPDHIRRGQHPDDWTCVCGNTPSDSGFYPSDKNGEYQEPDADGPWDGVHYVCDDCGRVIDQDTGKIKGKNPKYGAVIPNADPPEIDWKPVWSHCPTCAAIGDDPDWEPEKCPDCGGSGLYMEYTTSSRREAQEASGGVSKRELNIPTSPHLDAVLGKLNAKGHKPLIVGGAVRDALLGEKPKDVDVEVYGTNYDDLAETLKPHGKVNQVGKAFGVVKFTDHDRNEYDFSLPRRDNKTGVGHKDFKTEFDPEITPKEAASRRDFTFNSLAYDPVRKELHDYHGGEQDLKDKVIRHTSDQFAEDPLRVLRGMQFSARFGMSVAPETAELAKSIKHEYATIPKERVGEEFMKLATKGKEPGRAVDYLKDTGWHENFPALHACYGTPQDKEWHPEGDLEEHVKHSANAGAKIADREGLKGDDRAVTVLGSMCHDLGKPSTTDTSGEHVTSHGHDTAGEPITRQFLGDIGIKPSIAHRVAPLVREHMQHLNFGDGPTSRTVRRLADRLHPATIKELSHVMEADSNGRPPLEGGLPAGAKKMLDKASESNVTEKKQDRLVNGRDVMPYFNNEPGPHIGEHVNAAYEAQLNGEINTKEEGQRWLKQRLSRFEPGLQGDESAKLKQVRHDIYKGEDPQKMPPSQQLVCGETADAVAAKTGWEQEFGEYWGDEVRPEHGYNAITKLNPKEDWDRVKAGGHSHMEGYGHWWNRKTDGTIIDASSDQFKKGEGVRVIPPHDPRQKDYWTETTGVEGYDCEDCDEEGRPSFSAAPWGEGHPYYDHFNKESHLEGDDPHSHTTMFHVAPAHFREGIQSGGLKPSWGPEKKDRVYMWPTEESAQKWADLTTQMTKGNRKNDVWKVDTRRLDVRHDPNHDVSSGQDFDSDAHYVSSEEGIPVGNVQLHKTATSVKHLIVEHGADPQSIDHTNASPEDVEWVHGELHKEADWEGFPFDERKQEGPREKDSEPQKTDDGHFILYHGTSPEAAHDIMRDRHFKPDDMGMVGFGTTPVAARVYGLMKSKDQGVMLKAVIDKGWLSKQRAMHEIGGSGHSQFLVGSPDYINKNWSGVPSHAIKDVRLHEFKEASWTDVRNKAVRLRNANLVSIIGLDDNFVTASVVGDHDTYDVTLWRQFPGSSAITTWDCNCKWGEWAFKRQHTFVGRLCSHALATLYETHAQDRRKKSKTAAVDNDQWHHKGKPFSFGVVNILDGEIEETHTYKRAADRDFHHSLFVSPEHLNDDDKDVFWMQDGEPVAMSGLPPGIKGKIKKQIERAPTTSRIAATGKGKLTFYGGARPITIEVEVARDATSITQGLMNRQYLNPRAGMVFLYPYPPSYSGFWMMNTFIPLSIAFWDKGGRIIEVKDMEPCPPGRSNCPVYKCSQPYWGAVEVNRGFFRQWGIGPGSRVELNL